MAEGPAARKVAKNATTTSGISHTVPLTTSAPAELSRTVQHAMERALDLRGRSASAAARNMPDTIAEYSGDETTQRLMVTTVSKALLLAVELEAKGISEEEATRMLVAFFTEYADKVWRNKDVIAKKTGSEGSSNNAQMVAKSLAAKVAAELSMFKKQISNAARIGMYDGRGEDITSICHDAAGFHRDVPMFSSNADIPHYLVPALSDAFLFGKDLAVEGVPEEVGMEILHNLVSGWAQGALEHSHCKCTGPGKVPVVKEAEMDGCRPDVEYVRAKVQAWRVKMAAESPQVRPSESGAVSNVMGAQPARGYRRCGLMHSLVHFHHVTVGLQAVERKWGGL